MDKIFDVISFPSIKQNYLFVSMLFTNIIWFLYAAFQIFYKDERHRQKYKYYIFNSLGGIILFLYEMAEEKNHSLSSAIEFLREFYVLGLLVIIWESWHEKNKEIEIESQQSNSLETLLFFLQEESPKKTDDDTVPYAKIVNEQIKKIDEIINSTKEINKLDMLDVNVQKLLPTKGEYIFINMETTLNGLQDLVVDSQSRNEKSHTNFMQMYKLTRKIEFLNQRLYLVMNNNIVISSENDVQKNDNVKGDLLDLLSGIIDALDKINKCACSFFDDKKKFEVHEAVICRLYSVLESVCKLSSKEIKISLSSNETNKTDENKNKKRIAFLKAIINHVSNSINSTNTEGNNTIIVDFSPRQDTSNAA